MLKFLFYFIAGFIIAGIPVVGPWVIFWFGVSYVVDSFKKECKKDCVCHANSK